jgi:hypothetical protein
MLGSVSWFKRKDLDPITMEFQEYCATHHLTRMSPEKDIHDCAEFLANHMKFFGKFSN